MGSIYLAAAVVLGAIFLWQAYAPVAPRRVRGGSTAGAIRLYKYSISYLTLLFAAVAVDALVVIGARLTRRGRLGSPTLPGVASAVRPCHAARRSGHKHPVVTRRRRSGFPAGSTGFASRRAERAHASRVNAATAARSTRRQIRLVQSLGAPRQDLGVDPTHVPAGLRGGGKSVHPAGMTESWFDLNAPLQARRIHHRVVRICQS